jgi:hypothetical protein
MRQAYKFCRTLFVDVKYGVVKPLEAEKNRKIKKNKK